MGSARPPRRSSTPTGHDEFDIAWWVPAEDPALLPERLAELALALDLTTATTRPGWGWRGCWVSWPGGIAGCWCSTTPRTRAPRWLPEGPGQVLITSRNPAWRGIAATVGVREFTRAESIALLRRLAPTSPRGGGGSGGRRGRDLPLAVEQAGSLLADTGLTVDKYLRLLPSGPATCWTTTRAGPTRSRWRRPGRWRSTGSPPTTRPRWTC